ncbi:cutinase family protein [Nocardia rhizosphaerihabitans]|uniref:cutinase family protein n=1 Tax=Nocardia rhizosphaerihabitans TaxID=1691570 RepID=UPI00366B8527
MIGVAPASASPCKGLWTMGVGGFQISTDALGIPNFAQTSSYVPSDQPVGYNSMDINAGAREIERLYRNYRAQCPEDLVQILGHSGGAAAAHVWVSAHRYEQGVSVILASDPKRVAGPGGSGLAGHPLAGPVAFVGVFAGAAGTDANFGTVPVLDICNAGDWVCNRAAGVHGYLVTGVHGKYNLNPWSYPFGISGKWYQEIY